MKVYITDEIAYEISEHDIPDLLAATGPGELTCETWPGITVQQLEGRSMSVQGLDDAHLIGAIEGWLAGYRYACQERDGVGITFDEAEQIDDPEYPAKRRISRFTTFNEYGFSNDTIVLQARYGRAKKWVMAVNRRIPELGRIAIMEWIDNETREE